MTLPPDEPPNELERVVDAISDGAPVEWESELAAPAADPETLEALRLIADVARVHRGTSGPARDATAEAGGERTWGNLVLRERLGVGAYGEVHRAFDPGLQREVALKLWSEPDRPRIIEQLLEEARLLARVRHPNVLLVHGADVHDGRVGMWTELLEGSTLEELATGLGPGHWREAALYGIELCRALSAVHAIGLVHRDVKAANVMRERGGRIVLMDFGSASRYLEGAAGPGGPVQGTPLAMAPEVLAGAPASPAADVYSLGVLLFRFVAARYPVEADSLDGLRENLARAPLPSLRMFRPDVPLAFSHVIDRALERAPADRIGSAAEMERLLADALRTDWSSGTGPAGRAPVPAGRGALVRRFAAAALLASLGAGAWWLAGHSGAGGAQPMQFTLQLPDGEHLAQLANVVVSPDGSRIAFASRDSTGTRALWVRRFDALSSSRIPGTEGATYPFWSADGRNLAFFSGTHLKRVGVDGDSVRVVCEAELGRGGSWNQFGTILFAGSTQGPILRVPALGGTPVAASVLDTVNSEVSHRWPSFLPDGDHFLYVTTPASKGAYALYVGSLKSERRVYVGPVESGAAYTSGLLVYMFNSGLEARPFNPRTLRWAGEPVPVSAIPGRGGSIAEPPASVSANGTLVYSFEAARQSRLAWLDTHTGEFQALAIGPYFDPRLSPDGHRIAAERVEGAGRSNLWIVDAATGAAERMTDDNGLNRAPQWSPNGDSIVFASNRSGSYELYQRRTDGAMAERLLYSPSRTLIMWANDWRDGDLISFVRYEPGSDYNVYELRAGTVVPVAHTAASETRSALSPDARWLAYDSNASGHTRIVLLDRRTHERFVLPGEGGMQPRWARASGRLYYHNPAGTFFEVTPVPGKPPTEWPTRPLFRAGVMAGYDVDARGERLLCCLMNESGRPEEIAVLVNLPEAVGKGR